MERLASFKDSENRLTVERLRCTRLLRFSPCYKSGGGWSGKCSETGEVTISLCGMKSSNHRHLLITAKYWRRAGEIALLMSYVGMLTDVQMLILITVSPPFANILLAAVFRQAIT